MMKFHLLVSSWTLLLLRKKCLGSQILLNGKIDRLHIERSLVEPEAASALYREILRTATPGPKDKFSPHLVAIHGDGGANDDDDLTTSVKALKFQDIVDVHSNSTKRESGLLRVEHLKDIDKQKVDDLIYDVVPNKVLEEEGTIHLYLSRPDSSALANHTDTTDIAVLQLEGVKEWLFCQDSSAPLASFLKESAFHQKLKSCSTYSSHEMKKLKCEKQTLFPGDLLFLPRKIVHSARATSDGLSAHITFGFAPSKYPSCPLKDDEKKTLSSTSSRRLTTCNADEGGTNCNGSCSSNCNSDCDSGCDTSCDCYCFGYSCNGCCDSGCDLSCETCYGGCDTDCTECPSTGGNGLVGNGLVVGLCVVGSIIGIGAIAYYLYVCHFKNKKKEEQTTPNTDETERSNAEKVTGTTIVTPVEISADKVAVLGNGGDSEPSKAVPEAADIDKVSKIITKFGADGSKTVEKTYFDEDGNKVVEITEHFD